MSKFSDDEVDRYRSATRYEGQPAPEVSDTLMDQARHEMQRLVEQGWTPPEPPRFYAEMTVAGWVVRDRTRLATVLPRAAFYDPDQSVNEAHAKGYATRLNKGTA